MKRTSILPWSISLLLAALALPVLAQAPPGQPPMAEAPPPPGMDDPGVAEAVIEEEIEEALDAAEEGAASAGSGSSTDDLPPKILTPPPPEAAPAVSIRTDDSTGDVVEEYRQNGRLYMVKVTPRRGPSYMLMDTNGDGMLDRHDGVGNVRPVYWTIYEWN
jgi:hypothetical protein